VSFRLVIPHGASSDEDYISFMASLQASSTKRTEADTLEAFSKREYNHVHVAC
jgi:hypothetical protein